MKAFVGVSGFSYPAWKGGFYPDDLKTDGFLQFYASRLESVEINSSFYAVPGADVVKGWAGKTREGFKFAFKAPRQVTHVHRLGKGAADAALGLSAVLDGLGEKRGPILFQLPPFLKFDRELLDGFLSNTSSIAPKAFEFRHESWLNDRTYDLLEDHGAGFCVAETDDMEPVLMVTGGIAYFRLRKDAYGATAVGDWERRIRKTVEGADVGECFVYFRHDETGKNALLAEKLAVSLQS